MEKYKKTLTKLSQILEFIVAIIVFIAIIFGILHLYNPFVEYITHGSNDTKYFMEFLTSVLNIVIGIEFFRMLCTTEIDSVLEVVMFLLAKHLIVYELNAFDSLLMVIGIVVVFIVKKVYQEKESKKLES
ncbi:hypothetical protein [Floccifex sp.]|uniref:hypothetical protein n=1 Tax=Floccifex sp. TaxID=2815810 RepID=UPI003F0A0412